MAYWIDAGVLIQAHRGSLNQKIVPQFWQFLHEHVEAGTICMPRIAYEEVVDGGYDDEVVTWCKARKKLGLCCNETQAVQERYGILAAHVQEKHSKKPQQVRDWFDDADGWVIAHAFAEDDGAGIVVTEEYERATNKSKIKIPGLCKVFDIECINTAKLLRVLNADFSKGA